MKTKPYFAEYIPVKGKIKDEEMVMFKINGKWTQPCSFDSYLGPDIEDVAQGVLFICSRNVQINDEIYGTREGGWDTQHKGIAIEKDKGYFFIMEGKKKTRLYDCYKIVGSVSPNATWVKRGDRFEVDDLSAQGIGTNWCDENPDVGKFKFKIKCPTCNNFH